MDGYSANSNLAPYSLLMFSSHDNFPAHSSTPTRIPYIIASLTPRHSTHPPTSLTTLFTSPHLSLQPRICHSSRRYGCLTSQSISLASWIADAPKHDLIPASIDEKDMRKQWLSDSTRDVSRPRHDRGGMGEESKLRISMRLLNLGRLLQWQLVLALIAFTKYILHSAFEHLSKSALLSLLLSSGLLLAKQTRFMFW